LEKWELTPGEPSTLRDDVPTTPELRSTVMSFDGNDFFLLTPDR